LKGAAAGNRNPGHGIIQMSSMGFVDRLILRVKRADTPPTRLAKRFISLIYFPVLPPLPGWIKPPLRFLYEARYMSMAVFSAVLTICYRNPLFQARCASFGHRVTIGRLPFVTGHVQIHLGDDVGIGGNVSIISGRVYDEPKLIMKDRSGIGWGTVIAVNREVVIEEDARISYDCRISDTDGHPREADLRLANLPPDPRNIRPVRICRNAWIGNGVHIMKGVTIGEGAIIGANSVVISNIPPFALAMGNPAEVLIKNYGRPSTFRAKPSAQTQPAAQTSAPANS